MCRLSHSNITFLLPFWISLSVNFCVCHADYLRSWDLCLSFWISQSFSIVCSVEYLRHWDLCVMFEYLRSWDLCLPYWISQVFRSVSSVLIISVLMICVTMSEYLRSWVLCQPWIKYFRVLSLCQMRRITQNLKSVSTCQKTQIPKSVSTWWISQYSWSVSNV